MKIFLFENKKLWRSAGFRNLCLFVLAINLAFVLFGVVSEPSSAEKQAHLENYVDNISYVIRTAQRNLTEYQITAGKNSYLVRYQEDVIERYTALLEQGVTPLTVVGWDAFFDHTWDDLLLALIAVLTGAVLVMTEYDNGTHSLVKMTPLGKKSVQSKLLVLGLFAFVAALAIEMTTILGVALRFGVSSPTAPLCSVLRFTYCPSSVSILGYLTISLLARTVYAWAIMLFAATMSALFRSYLVSFFACVGSLVTGYAISRIPTNNGWLFLNPYTLGVAHPLWERYRSVNVFGLSIPLFLVAAMLLILTCLTLGAAFVWCIGRTAEHSTLQKWEKTMKTWGNRFKERLGALLPRRKPHRHTLFFTEIKKNFVKSHLLFLCIVMLLIKLFYAETTLPQSYYTEKYYRTVCEMFSGEATEEKQLVIADKLQQSATVIARENSMRDAMMNGSITGGEYSAYQEEYNQATLDQFAFTRLLVQCQRIDSAAEKGQDAYIIYDTGWSYVLTATSDIILYAFVVLFFSGTYNMEYNSNFHYFAATTTRGMKAIRKEKQRLAAVVATVAFAVYFIIDLVLVAQQFPLSHASFSLASIIETPLSLPLWMALTLFCFYQMVKVVCLAILSCLASRFLRKFYLSLPTSILFCYVIYCI